MTRSPELFWFVPASGDFRYLGDRDSARAGEFDYLAEVARTADVLGFDGVLIPTGWTGLESLTLAAALAPVTKRLKLLTAIRPGLISPVAAARIVSTLDDVSGGRVLLNIVTGDRVDELKGDGLFLDHDARYRLTDEWLTIFRRLLQGETVDYEGQYLHVRGARNLFRPVQEPYPPIYFGGSSEAAIAVAGKHVDVYLSWGEPPEQIREKFAAVREAAAREGRSVRFGARFHVVVRRTEEEAWQAAEELIQHAAEEAFAQAAELIRKRESVGQQRMAALHGGSRQRERLRVGRHLWAGVGLLRAGAGTALVGSPDQVAEAIAEYQSLGVETFILSGYPHMEEALYVAELLFPALGKRSPVFNRPTVLASDEKRLAIPV